MPLVLLVRSANLHSDQISFRLCIGAICEIGACIDFYSDQISWRLGCTSFTQSGAASFCRANGMRVNTRMKMMIMVMFFRMIFHALSSKDQKLHSFWRPAMSIEKVAIILTARQSQLTAAPRRESFLGWYISSCQLSSITIIVWGWTSI